MLDFFSLSYEDNIKVAADFHAFIIAEHSGLAAQISRLNRTLGEAEFLAERALFSVVEDGDALRVQPVIALFASESIALRVAERALDLFSLYLPSAHDEEQILTADIGIENLAVLWDRYQSWLEKRD